MKEATLLILKLNNIITIVLSAGGREEEGEPQGQTAMESQFREL